MQQDAFSKYHPATNFLFFVGAIGFAVLTQHPLYLCAGCVGAVSYYALLRGRECRKMLLGMVPVFLLVAGTNPLFNTYGETVLFTVFGRPYTREALFYGMVIGGMLVLMMLWFGCYSIVLTSDKFVCLFGRLIPSLSLLLVMVLRLIPSLTRKAKQILDARRSIGRGVGAESRNREKLLAGVNVLSALTDWALEGAIITADSMRARGYGTAKRTSFQIYHLGYRDVLLITVMLLLVVAAIVAGDTMATFTPEFYIAPPGWGLAAYLCFLMIPSVLQIKEVLQWRISRSKI